MNVFFGIVGFAGIVVFISIALFALYKKKGGAKKYFICAGISFVLLAFGISITELDEEAAPVATEVKAEEPKADEKEAEAKAKADEAKAQQEKEDKAKAEAEKKKAAEEKAAADKAEKEAVAKAEAEKKEAEEAQANAVKKSEEEYSQFSIQTSEQVTSLFQELKELSTAASDDPMLMLDDTWKMDVVVVYESITEQMQGYIDYQGVPDKFSETHSLMVKAAHEYIASKEKFYNGVDNFDGDSIMESKYHIDQGNLYIREATNLLNSMGSEY